MEKLRRIKPVQLPVSYGDEFAKCFYLTEAPSYLIRPRSQFQLAMTRLALSRGLPGPARSVIPERGFTISIHLIQPVCRGWGTWVAGKYLPISSWAVGGVGIYDLESDPIAIRPKPLAVHERSIHPISRGEQAGKVGDGIAHLCGCKEESAVADPAPGTIAV